MWLVIYDDSENRLAIPLCVAILPFDQLLSRTQNSQKINILRFNFYVNISRQLLKFKKKNDVCVRMRMETKLHKVKQSINY